MPAHDDDEILSPTQVVEILSKNTSEQVGQLTVALLYIVDALKKQPNFNVELFNAKLIEGASSNLDPEESLIRTVLLVAAGKDIEPKS